MCAEPQVKPARQLDSSQLVTAESNMAFSGLGGSKSQQTGNAPRLVEAGLSGGLKQLMQGESRVKKVWRESVLTNDRSYQWSAQRFERLLGIQLLINVELKRNLIFGTRSREVNFEIFW